MIIITKVMRTKLFCSVLIICSFVSFTIQMYHLYLVKKKKSNFLENFYESHKISYYYLQNIYFL